jgi:hypothetical protein
MRISRLALIENASRLAGAETDRIIHGAVEAVRSAGGAGGFSMGW